jgi:hypothetical protein
MVRGTDAYCTCSDSTVFIYGGIFLAAAAAVVAHSDCVRGIPLLIVHGLMWAESVALAFFVTRLSGVPAARVLFFVGGEVRCFFYSRPSL